MHRLRLHFLLVLVLAVGASCVAKGQNGSSSLDDQIQNKFNDRERDKAKASHEQDKAKTKNNDDHRKHWWSLPHFGHKKHDNDSAVNQPDPKSNSKTVAAKPMNKTATPAHKTATTTAPSHKTFSRKADRNKTAANGPRKKTVAATSHGKKAVRHNCSSADAKKSGCEPVHSAKATTSPS